MRYELKDFKRCLLNPLDKGNIQEDKRLSLIWPNENSEIESADEWDNVSRETLIRYIICLYDPESPLLRDEPNLNQRKIEAAMVAGYNIEKQQDWLEKEIYPCRNEYVVYVIARYLQLRKSREFAGLMADEQTYWEFIHRLMEPVTKADKDRDLMSALDIKTKLSAAKEEINARLMANWKKFFNDDEDAMRQVSKINIWSPESMAGVR